MPSGLKGQVIRLREEWRKRDGEQQTQQQPQQPQQQDQQHQQQQGQPQKQQQQKQPKQKQDQVQTSREEGPRPKGESIPINKPARTRSEDEWVLVEGRGKTKRNRNRATKGPAPVEGARGIQGKGGIKKSNNGNAALKNPQDRGREMVWRLPKAPRTAAVVLTAPEGGYGEAFKRVTSQVKIQDFGINGLRTRRARTGAIVLEIAGAGASEKAGRLASAMSGVLGDVPGVRVTQPIRMAEVRVWDIPEFTTKEEVVEAVTGKTKCAPEEVRVGR